MSSEEEGGWITDAEICPFVGQRIRRPVPPPFCDAVDIVGSLPVTVEDAPYRPTVHVSIGEGVVIAYKAEGSPGTEPGESYDPDAPMADAGGDDETDEEEKPRFRNARRTPALYKVKYDAPSSFVVGDNEDETPPPIYMEDLTLSELEPALAAARKRLTSSIPQSQLQICGKQVVSYHATLDRRGDEALAMMISGLDDEGRDVDKLEGCDITPGILPNLCLIASAELDHERRLRAEYDMLVKKLTKSTRSKRSADSGRSTRSGRKSRANADAELPPAPRYYSTHPTTYLGGQYVPPDEAAAKDAALAAESAGTGSTAEDAESATAAALAAASSNGFNPASVAQRVKLGCSLAWEYVRKVDPDAAGMSSAQLGVASRKSSRARTPVNYGSDGENADEAELEDEYDEKGNLKPPSGEVMGGRVAVWLLTELGYVESESKEEEGEQNGDGDAKMDDAEEGSDDKKKSSEEHEAITIDPAFLPTPFSIVNHLGRTHKSMSPKEIQQAMCKCVTYGMSTPLFVLEEQREIRRQRKLAGLASKTAGKKKKKRRKPKAGIEEEDETWMVLQCISGDKTSDLPQYEPSSFARCRFLPKTYVPDSGEEDEEEEKADADGDAVMDDTAGEGAEKGEAGPTEEELEEERQALLQQQAVEAERLAKRREAEKKWRERKFYEIWRFKSVNGGYTNWPGWGDTLTEELLKHGVDKNAPASEAPSAAASGTTTPAEGATGTSQEDNDAALAQSLAAEAEAAPAGRRSRRAAAKAVVYTTETNTLSAGVLLDRICRMISKSRSQSGFQTILDFRSLVLENTDSSAFYDYQAARSMRRLRSVLGKIVYRMRRSSHILINSKGDERCWNALIAGGLIKFELPRAVLPAFADERVQARVSDINQQEEQVDNDLVQLQTYLEQLQFVELTLRKFILSTTSRNALLPNVRSIAVAADERPDELEAMDAKDFENGADINWQNEGHELIGKTIYRPEVTVAPPRSPSKKAAAAAAAAAAADPSAAPAEETPAPDTSGPCQWYKIVSFTPSVPLDEASESAEEEFEGGDIVKRRIRFRAHLTDLHEAMSHQSIILTEAQVRAGMEAAELMDKANAEKRAKTGLTPHPFAGKVGTVIVLRDADQLAEAARIRGGGPTDGVDNTNNNGAGQGQGQYQGYYQGQGQGQGQYQSQGQGYPVAGGPSHQPTVPPQPPAGYYGASASYGRIPSAAPMPAVAAPAPQPYYASAAPASQYYAAAGGPTYQPTVPPPAASGVPPPPPAASGVPPPHPTGYYGAGYGGRVPSAVPVPRPPPQRMDSAVSGVSSSAGDAAAAASADAAFGGPPHVQVPTVGLTAGAPPAAAAAHHVGFRTVASGDDLAKHEYEKHRHDYPKTLHPGPPSSSAPAVPPTGVLPAASAPSTAAASAPRGPERHVGFRAAEAGDDLAKHDYEKHSHNFPKTLHPTPPGTPSHQPAVMAAPAPPEQKLPAPPLSALAATASAVLAAAPAPVPSVQQPPSGPIVLSSSGVPAGAPTPAVKQEVKKEAPAKKKTPKPKPAPKPKPVYVEPVRPVIPPAPKVDQILATVMGFDTTYSAEDIKEWKTKGHRVLLLPISEKKANEDGADAKKEGNVEVKKEDEEEKEKPEAFWAIVSSDGTIVKAKDKTWELSLHSYGPTSHAHDACAEILELVSSHAKAGPFMVPVDPEALNIPTYFDVIKHPMDLGTMQKKLDAGDYSINLPPPVGEDEYTIRSNSIQTMVYGPFYDDLVRIFDNAMTFNPPGDWIHNEAVALKKAALKRLDQVFHRAVKEADREKTQAAKKEAKKSVYVEEDSDVDMYEYESDYDDDVGGAGSKRSRGRKKKKKKPEKEEDNATKAIEAPIRLPRVSDTNVTEGILTSLPISTNAKAFSMPPEWTVRYKTKQDVAEEEGPKQEDDGVDEFALQEEKDWARLGVLDIALNANQQHSLRRSTRAAAAAEAEQAEQDAAKALAENLKNTLYSDGVHKAKSREEIEATIESIHEGKFAHLYYKYFGGDLVSEAGFVDMSKPKPVSKVGGDLGLCAGQSFPPYLGRIVPTSTGVSKSLDGAKGNPIDATNVTWEIREPYASAAIRWVVRGLIKSGHLAEIEAMDGKYVPNSNTYDERSGAVIANNAYYKVPSATPFDVLDIKAAMRQKRAELKGEEEESSEEEVEMSEYEQMRAARVARNQERLKMLGLA